MKIIKTELDGVLIIENFHSTDERGCFVKTYHEEFFKKKGIYSDFKESFFSVSKKNVIRGMHFQLPPCDHEKLVYVANGEAVDVVLDLRKKSDTYGKAISIILNDKNRRSVFIPKGFAHGFKSMVDDTIMVYNVSTIYDKGTDFGVSLNSFDYNWCVETPIVSERDKELMSLKEFNIINPW